APEVGSGVDEPGSVQAKRDAEERSPEHHTEATDNAMAGRCDGSAKNDLQDAGNGERDPVILREPDVDLLAGEIGGVATEQGGLRVQSASGEDPAGVCPPRAVVRCVWIAFVVRVLMMDAMCGDPEDRSTFERHRAAHGDEVFHPWKSFVAAMCQQAMVGHADADVDREKIHDSEYRKIFP